MNQVEWIIAPSNSIWTRDYGPWFVFDGNGDIAIINHYYNRPYRPDDNNIPIVCGAEWGIPVYSHDLWTTGGNYMTDGHGISFSTDLVWDENSGHDRAGDLRADARLLRAQHLQRDRGHLELRDPPHRHLGASSSTRRRS